MDIFCFVSCDSVRPLRASEILCRVPRVCFLPLLTSDNLRRCSSDNVLPHIASDILSRDSAECFRPFSDSDIFRRVFFGIGIPLLRSASLRQCSSEKILPLFYADILHRVSSERMRPEQPSPPLVRLHKGPGLLRSVRRPSPFMKNDSNS